MTNTIINKETLWQLERKKERKNILEKKENKKKWQMQLSKKGNVIARSKATERNKEKERMNERGCE